MSEFEKKLRETWALYYEEGDANFYEWMILHAETEHKKSVKMAGDLGAALSKIGDLEREKHAIKDKIMSGEACNHCNATGTVPSGPGYVDCPSCNGLGVL